MVGNVRGLPPNYFGWQLYIHKGLDLAGGTHIDYELTNFPAGQSRADVQQRTIDVITKRVQQKLVQLAVYRGLPLTVDCRIGFAVSQDPPDSADELLRLADEQMQGKKSGTAK